MEETNLREVLQFGGNMAENVQSKRSKKWISDALTELMKKKPFAEITVKDITEKAGVARLTFYRHFQTKEEVLNYRFQELFSEYLTAIESTDAKSLLEALSICFSYWKKNAKQIMDLKENGLDAMIYAPFSMYLDTMLTKYQANAEMLDIQRQFLVGGLYFSMTEYIMSCDALSPTQAAEAVLKLLKLDIQTNLWDW